MASSTTPDHEAAVNLDFQSYIDLLNSDTALLNIMSKGSHTLTLAQRRRLRTLYTFFDPSELSSTTVPEESLSLSPLAGSRKRKGTFADDNVSQGWGEGALKRVKIPLSLPDFMAASLQNNPAGDAATFLDNMDIVKLISNGTNSGSSSEDAFEKLVENIYKSESQAGKNGIRWLYLMLCVYDVFQRKFPNKSRVSSKMKAIFQTELKTHIAQATSGNHSDMAVLTDKVNIWFNSGQKLDILCKQFGNGSLIILVDLLTQDFVENRITKTGKAKDKSFDYFEYHKLKPVAETTGAAMLGENIRRTLCRAFPI